MGVEAVSAIRGRRDAEPAARLVSPRSSGGCCRRALTCFGRIDRSIGEPPCARRCRRTEARNATVGSGDQTTPPTAAEANRPLKAVLERPDSSGHGRGGEHPGEGVLTLAGGSGDSGRTLAAG